MSLVGSRPDVEGYADCLKGEDYSILEPWDNRACPATIEYRNEDSLLLEQADPNTYNDSVIWPDKVKIN